MSVSIEADVNDLGRSSRADRLPGEIHPTLSSQPTSPRRRRSGWRLSFTGLDEPKEEAKVYCFVHMVPVMLHVHPA